VIPPNRPAPLTVNPRRLTFAALGLCLLPAVAPAFDTSRIEDPEVRACAERALPTRTARQIQRVHVISEDGHVRESLREMHWKRSENNDSRVLVRMLEPLEDKGVGVLVNDDAERNQTSYMSYSPKIKRVRRVTGESFFGTILATDFTYEDFSFFYRTDEREQVKRVDDAVLDDKPAYVLETIKTGDNAHYGLARFFIDQQVCLPVRTEFIARNGTLRKELLIDREQIKMVDEHWIPFHVTVLDHKLDSQEQVLAGQQWDLDRCAEAGLEPVPLRCNRGECLIWHHSLLHGGSYPTGDHLTRKSFVVHYTSRAHMQATQNTYIDPYARPEEGEADPPVRVYRSDVTHRIGGRHGFMSPLVARLPEEVRGHFGRAAAAERRIAQLERTVAAGEREIETMKASRFWKLRDAWWKLRRAVGRG